MAKAEIVSDDDPAQVHFVDKLINEILPIHMHNALAEVDDDNVVYVEVSLQYVLPVLGAVYERNGLVENKSG